MSDSNSSSPRSDSPPLALDPSTLALLNSFLSEKAAQERKFEEITGSADTGDAFKDGTEGKGAEKGPISLSDYFTAFGEDWQLSQFWYTEQFANELARALYDLCVSISSENEINVAFLCAPTAFVGFQRYLYELDHSPSSSSDSAQKPKINLNLFEYDTRFAHLAFTSPPLNPPTSTSTNILHSSTFTHYNLHTPLALPTHHQGVYDIVLVDPPFLNEDTIRSLGVSVDYLARSSEKGTGKGEGKLEERGKFLLITSLSTLPFLDKVYTTASESNEKTEQEGDDAIRGEIHLGPLYRSPIHVQHQKLAHEYGCWGNWEGAETFGAVSDASSL